MDEKENEEVYGRYLEEVQNVFDECCGCRRFTTIQTRSSLSSYFSLSHNDHIDEEGMERALCIVYSPLSSDERLDAPSLQLFTTLHPHLQELQSLHLYQCQDLPQESYKSLFRFVSGIKLLHIRLESPMGLDKGSIEDLADIPTLRSLELIYAPNVLQNNYCACLCLTSLS